KFYCFITIPDRTVAQITGKLAVFFMAQVILSLFQKLNTLPETGCLIFALLQLRIITDSVALVYDCFINFPDNFVNLSQGFFFVMGHCLAIYILQQQGSCDPEVRACLDAIRVVYLCICSPGSKKSGQCQQNSKTNSPDAHIPISFIFQKCLYYFGGRSRRKRGYNKLC